MDKEEEAALVDMGFARDALDLEPSMLQPTDEQQAILNNLPNQTNLMIRARPGTGKTETLRMIDQATTSPNLLLCFNKAIATEAEKKIKPATTVRTFNSLGHRVWTGACAKKLSLDKDKQRGIFKVLVDGTAKHLRQEWWDRYDLVMQGVNLARAVGYIPTGHQKEAKRLATSNDLEALLDERPDPQTWDIIDSILTRSIKLAYDGAIDFPDQCYMPALFGGTYPQFPLVLIDEYQDLSPVNQAMVAKLCKSAQQIGVGDEAQAIYAFRGAYDGGMGAAIKRFSMQVMPLTLSWRCPSKIVENVHWRAPDFRWSREGGTVDTSQEIARESAVLCRNNAPLLAVAMKLLGQGYKVDVAGTDISGRIIRQLTKLGPEEMTKAQALSAVDEWEAHKLDQESKSAADTADCMRVFIQNAANLGGAIAYARHLFALSGTTRFLTGHKAKGLEFDRVYHLDSGLCRGRGQDPNIKFVIDTRAREHLSYIDSRSLDHDHD